MALPLFARFSMEVPQEVLALQIISVFVVFQLVRWFHNHFTWCSISYLPGPRKTDWFFGNLTDLHFNEVGDPHISWQKKHGHNFKIHGPLGTPSHDFRSESDSTYLCHIANSNTFVRQKNNRELIKMIVGPGVTIVNGDARRRQRRVMQPAFGLCNLKALFPVFMRHVQKIVRFSSRLFIIDVHDHIVNVILDIIGDAAFDYQFGALDNKQDELREIIRKSSNSLGCGTKLELLFQYGLEWLPPWFISALSYLPISKFSQLRAGGEKLSEMAGQMVQEKMDALRKGLEGEKDLMSLLVRANAKEKPSERLSDLEVNSEIATIIFGGHGTTANTLSFALWELAKDVDLQQRLRQEIKETLRRVQANGETEIGFDEYDNMSLLVAFIKEVLRWHPVGFAGARQAIEDSVIPLAHPVELESGKVINEIPVSKGQQIWVNIPGYNRLPEIFGKDADDFNIKRWMDDKSNQMTEQGVGIYSNLLTFAHGPRACIGWKFSLLEMQMLLIEFISDFEFTLPTNGKSVRRTSSTMMVPTIEGEQDSGIVLFLNVSVVGD